MDVFKLVDHELKIIDKFRLRLCNLRIRQSPPVRSALDLKIAKDRIYNLVAGSDAVVGATEWFAVELLCCTWSNRALLLDLIGRSWIAAWCEVGCVHGYLGIKFIEAPTKAERT